MNREQAHAWYKAVQSGEGVDRESFPVEQRGGVAALYWDDPTFTLGIEYGVLIAIRRIFGFENALPSPEWVRLIPAGSIPVFCLPSGTYDAEIERVRNQLVAFFGEGKVLVVRGEVEIYAIAEGERPV